MLNQREAPLLLRMVRAGPPRRVSQAALMMPSTLTAKPQAPGDPTQGRGLLGHPITKTPTRESPEALTLA